MNTFRPFEITDTLEVIRRDIIDAQIAGDDDEIQALMEKLDALYSERSEKHEDYIHVIKNAEMEAKALNTLAKLLRGTLLDDMIQHGEKQNNVGKFRLSRRNGARVVLHIDAGELPEAYRRITADTTALKRALSGGEVIEGVELEPTEHVRIDEVK